MALTPTTVAWRRCHQRDERGDVILGWFTRVATFLLLLGIIAFEGISLTTAHIGSKDVASDVAIAAADAYVTRKNPKDARAAADLRAIAHHATIVPHSFHIFPDGSVDVKITMTATTLFLYRTPATAKWAVVSSTGHANGQFR